MPNVVVTGIKEIDRKLATLEARVQKKIVRQQMRAALKPLLSEWKSDSPVESGAMRRGVVLRAGKRSRQRISMRVTIDRDKVSAPTDGEFYPAFEVFGAHDRPPDPRWQSDWDHSEDSIRRRLFDGIKAGIVAEATRG